MSKGDIRLSKKYGVNPSIPICFWCGQEKNEIALLGHIGDGRKGEDLEAPRNILLDYEPCDGCQKNMALGVTVMEAGISPIFKNQPEFQPGTYPTGKWIVLKKEAADRIFGDELKGHNKIFVDSETFKHFVQTEES